MSAGPAPGGEASGGGGELEQLAALLEQLGITPEQLEAAMAQGGGDAGGAGEMPPEAMPPEAAMGGAGGMPPAAGGPETAGAAPGMEVSAADKGRATKRAAQKGAADQTTRDYVQEVLARSRQ
jgi:hypothetical protein